MGGQSSGEGQSQVSPGGVVDRGDREVSSSEDQVCSVPALCQDTPQAKTAVKS